MKVNGNIFADDDKMLSAAAIVGQTESKLEETSTSGDQTKEKYDSMAQADVNADIASDGYDGAILVEDDVDSDDDDTSFDASVSNNKTADYKGINLTKQHVILDE